MVLSKASLLKGRYTIQSVLGEVGPLDITYLAWDVKTEREVVIREYFPLRFARRAAKGSAIEVLDAKPFEYGLSLYGREGELLGEFSHPSVITTGNQFRENGTLYRVSEHITGPSLAAYLKRNQGAFTEEEALDFIAPLLEGLARAHSKHLYHGNLSPKSIIISEDGRPMLLNFQMARTRLGVRCGMAKEMLAQGFYPADKLKAEDMAAWDIYACGAVLFYLFTGHVLPQALTPTDYRHVLHAVKFDHVLSPQLRKALLHSVAYAPGDRPSSITSFQETLRQAIYAHALNSEPEVSKPSFEIGYQPSSNGQDKIHINGAAKHIHTVKHIHIAQRPASPTANHKTHLMQDPNLIPQEAPRENTPVPAHRAEYLPRPADEKDPDIEVMLFKMLRRQQYFVLSIVAVVILVLGTIGGIFVLPRYLGDNSEPIPTEASAAETSPEQRMSSQDAGVTPDLPAATPVESTPSGTTPSETTPSATTSVEANAGPVTTETDESSFNNSPASAVSAPESDATQTAALAENNQPENNQPENSQQRNSQPSNGQPASVQTSATPADTQNPGNASPPSQPVVDDSGANTGGSTANEAPVAAAPGESTNSRLIAESEIRELIKQGNVFYQENKIREALVKYEAALTLQPDNTELSDRISEINRSLEDEARKLAEAESLRIRLSKVTDDNGIFIAPDSAPVLLNEKELAGNIKYPSQARRAGIEGRVIIRLIVDEHGKAESPQVVQGIGFGCDEEVIRLLKDARFEPATFNKEAVKAWTMYSLVFSLN